jgi:hypothetical protein
MSPNVNQTGHFGEDRDRKLISQDFTFARQCELFLHNRTSFQDFRGNVRKKEISRMFVTFGDISRYFAYSRKWGNIFVQPLFFGSFNNLLALTINPHPKH